MSNIHILDESTINKIAAGEVVERPSSVIKELVENSIDAGSTAITVEIKNGGVSLIRVTDNGMGMTSEDAKKSFIRHATSKIRSALDLDTIKSLGFRGEALSSISAVSQMQMISRTRDSISGIKIVNNGGKIESIQEVGSPEGTTIIAENLFYNTPARMKFLRSTRSETADISDLLSRLIISHPEISFKYINNGKVIYHSPGNRNLLSSIITIYGKDVKNDIIEFNAYDNEIPIEIYGFAGTPYLARSTRNHQSFFVNKRYIKSMELSKAVENAYESLITSNQFPWIVLNIIVPPESIDVNVHPTKTEIRFRDNNVIFDFIEQNIRKTLLEKKHVSPFKTSEKNVVNKNALKIGDMTSEKDLDVEQTTISIWENDTDNKNSLPAEIKWEQNKNTQYITISRNNYKENNNLLKKGMNDNDNDNNNINLSHKKIIGVVFGTYIVIEDEDKIWFVDQHAAHERLIYEDLKKMYSNNKKNTQSISPPVVLDITYSDYELINDSIDDLQNIGFDLEPFGKNSFIIRGVPFLFGKLKNVKVFFYEMIDQLIETKSLRNKIIDCDDIIRAACKKAVKAHDLLKDIEIKTLLNRLDNEDIILTCPHGRPIVTTINKYELEKRFKRV